MALRQRIRYCAAHDGVRLAWASTGHGPPLVKVGNWLSHLDFDLDSPVWGHVLGALSESHTVIRYDQRGTGLSDRDVAEISFDAWVRDLDAVLDAAGIERAPLLCISQGVPVAVAYVTQHQERVSRLILHGGYARGRAKRPGDDTLQRQEAETLARLAEIGWGRDDPSFRQFFTSQFLPDGTAEQHRWFNELAQVSTSPQNAGRMLRVFDQIDVGALLAEVRCPTLVLHATGDLRVPFAEGRFIAGQIGAARFVPLDTAHHLVLAQDRAWPRWLDEVRDFLGAPQAGDAGAFAGLTRRERELLELIAQGRDNGEVAAALGLSEKTVRNHVTSIFAKLDVETRARAIVMAREAGLGRGASGEA